MRYAKILAKGVVTSDRFFDGSKPYDEKPPQATDGMIAIPDRWEEAESEIVIVWKLIPADESDLAAKAEAFDILMGVGE